MRNRQEQTMGFALKFANGDEIQKEIKGTHTGNLYSKLSSQLKEILTNHCLDDGATITFVIEKAQEDEFERPVPE